MENKIDNIVNKEIENNELEIQPTKEELIEKYEADLLIAKQNYKKASGSLEYACDPYEEECIKDDMELFKKEVKSLRAKIDSLVENC